MNKWLRFGLMILFSILLIAVLGGAFYIFFLKKVYRPLPTPIIEYNHPLVDKSFLTGETCQPPCWYDLLIGETSKENALSNLKEQIFILEASITERSMQFEDEEDSVELKYDCVYIDGRTCGSLYFVDDILELNIMHLGYPLFLKDVVKKIGPPDYIDSFYQGNSCQFEFLWYQLGIKAIHSEDIAGGLCEDENVTEGVFNPDLLISTLWYGSEKRFQNCKALNCVTWQGFIDE